MRCISVNFPERFKEQFLPLFLHALPLMVILCLADSSFISLACFLVLLWGQSGGHCAWAQAWQQSALEQLERFKHPVCFNIADIIISFAVSLENENVFYSLSLQVWSILAWIRSMSLPLGPLALPAAVTATATGAKS